MPLDPKIARHVCSVIRRQIQSYIPELYIHFVIHSDEDRAESFSKSTNTLNNHPAGKYILNYQDDDFKKSLFETNESGFSCLAKHHKSGFLGFFQDRAYLALCFLNHTHFESEEEIRNHAIHIVWHAISAYRSSLKPLEGETNDHAGIEQTRDLVFSKLTGPNLVYQNLMADIFSVSIQMLQGHDTSIQSLATQRIKQTLNKRLHTRPEDYPLPMCLDTLAHILKEDLEQYRKNSCPLKTAIKITQELKNTYDLSTIEQWVNFSTPAQQMAWMGGSPEEILGAALYTGENIHVQSIADIIAEHLKIQPKPLTAFDNYNPFAENTAMLHVHEKRCSDLKSKVFETVKKHSDFTILLDIAERQNKQFHEHSVLGWCGSGFIRAADILRQEHSTDDFTSTLTHAKEAFDKEIKSIPWETLAYFSEHLFKAARNGDFLNQETILKIVESNEEFSSIYYTIKAVDDWGNRIVENMSELQEQTNSTEPEIKRLNISDFISPNKVRT